MMFPLDVLREPVWLPLTWTLLHFLWQGLAVAVVVAAFLYVWPVRHAHNRYLIYLSALVAMAACPLVTFMIVDVPESAAVARGEAETEVEVPIAPGPEPEFVATETPVGPTGPAVRESQPSPESPVAAAPEMGDSANLPVPVTWQTQPKQYVDAIQPYAMIVWIAGVTLLAVRLSLSWLHVRWLAWGCLKIPADLATKAATLGERLGLRFPPRVCISEKIREAIGGGLWRPLVLLPASWLSQMPPEVLEAVIAHELAHVRRLDLWVNLLQRLMETLLFYHPAVWWLSRRVSLEREMCADELAIGATRERLAYATALEQLGRMRLGQTAPQFGASIGGNKMVLLSRVGNILGLSASNKKARWWPVGLLAVAVPLAIWLASTRIVASTENETRAEEDVASTSEALDKAELKRWIEKADSPVASQFEAAVEALVAMGPEVTGEMIPLLKTGRTDRLGLKVLEALAPEPSVQRILVSAVEEARDGGNTNVVHCGLIALGKSGNVAHSDFIASFLDTNDIAATSALATLGGDRAADHLIGAFDTVETERWFMLAGALERLGDPAALPELKRRLAQVELPPNDRFPPATVAGMTGAITALSKEKETFTTTSYCQGQHFRYPFDRPGAPKTFSVNPLRNHYVRRPRVDPQTTAGREAIWKAMKEATEGPGFTIDGSDVVAFHGLKLAPLWPDGRPYPITLYDWLRRTSHQVLRQLIDREKQTGRCSIPKGGLLVALDPAGRLYVLSLKRTSDKFTYNVTVMPQDPNMQLIPVRANAEAMQFTRVTGCTLYDLESETKDGSLNLNRGHLQTMTREKWRAKSTDAVLVVEFAHNETALGVPGAERFLLAEAGEAWEKPRKLLALLKAAAKEEPTITGHSIVKHEGAIFHAFSELSEGRKFAFAVRMPDGIPVAGMLEVRTVDRKAETLGIRYRSLTTAAARDVFAKDDTIAANAVAEEIGVTTTAAWGPKGTDGLQIRLVIPKSPGESVPALTDEQYFKKVTGVLMTPKVRLELKNAGEKPIRLAEQNMNGGRRNIVDEWLIGLSLDMQVGETVQRLTRTDNQDDFWSVIGNMPNAQEIKPGETVTFGLRLHKLADERGRPLSSLRGAVQLRPVLEIRDGRFGLWHGTARGKFVPVAIQDEPDAAWGKPVEGVQSRLRRGAFRNGEQWLSFDLCNASSNQFVQLGPGGMPTEILVDNVPYLFTGDFVGQLPVCKPAQRVTGAEFKLDKNWMPTKMVSGPETLELKPGKHTVQAIVYAAAKDAENTGRKVRVLSNPVEIEIRPPAARAAKPAPPADADARERFLAIERLARLPMPQRAKQLSHLYKDLAPLYMTSMVEGMLGNHRENILNPNKFDGMGGDHTTRWAKQLADAASEMTPEEVADKLGHGLWLNAAARARAIDVFKKHADATAALIEADLKTRRKQPVERAAATIREVPLLEYTDQLLAAFLRDDETSQPAFFALVFLRDAPIVRPLLEEVKKDPKVLIRCAGLFQGPLHHKPAEPQLLELLNSTDAKIRNAAVRALYECSDPKLAQPAAALAGEKEPRLRTAAAHIASNLPKESFKAVRGELLPLLDDQDEAVRIEALRCFCQQKDVAAGPVILKLLKQNQLGESGTDLPHQVAHAADGVFLAP